MTDRPILFSGEMVRAILEGRKTQTRRVLRIQPLEILTPRDRTARELDRVTRKWGGCRTWFALTERGETIEGNRGCAFRCKYGEVGDRLWVRETWTFSNGGDDEPEALYRADPIFDGMGPGDFAWKWSPSIHMPRWASRITLEVTDVRVERVQDISGADCYAEGVKTIPSDQRAAFVPGTDIEASGGLPDERYRRCYAQLWDSLNAKRGYGWDVDPWVWAISFRAVA